MQLYKSTILLNEHGMQHLYKSKKGPTEKKKKIFISLACFHAIRNSNSGARMEYDF